MAVAHVSSTYNLGSGASASLSLLPSGDNRLLLVGIAYSDLFGGVFIDGPPTFNGVAMTEVGVATGAGLIALATFILVAPAALSRSVDVVFSDSAEWAVFGSVYSGVSQSAPLGSVATATGNSSEASVSLGSTANDGMVADALVVDALSANVAGSPHGAQVERVDATTGTSPNKLSLGASDDDAGGPATMAWTLTHSRGWAHRAIELLAAPAGGARRGVGRGMHGGRRLSTFAG